MAEPFNEKADLALWQRRLLPWAIGLLFGLVVFFLIASWVHFDRLSASIAERPQDEISAAFAAHEAAEAPDFAYLQWKTTVLMERATVDHRYRQINTTLLLRSWTRHLGFLTGMILAFIGSIFILSKLSERESRLSAETSGLKGALATSSPGIVLAVVGGMLMLATIVVDYRFSTVDAPAYLRLGTGAGEDPAPLPVLDTEETRAAEEAELMRDREGSGSR